MADIEKVIKSLELCVQGSKGCLKDCPYTDKGCRIQLEKDALELLKERVKAKVVFAQYDGSVETECGNCGQHLDKTYSHCPKCQMELDWNEGQR